MYLSLGWRHLAVNHSDGDTVFDGAMSGPVVGPTLQFCFVCRSRLMTPGNVAGHVARLSVSAGRVLHPVGPCTEVIDPPEGAQ